ncbi:MAG: hypothetical protein CSA49_06190 [Gammaproteobacteria bacterium]|nr:MAG: hypothetical protein CSA49_06190 [Gammaproteobacteria bacterium]
MVCLLLKQLTIAEGGVLGRWALAVTALGRVELRGVEFSGAELLAVESGMALNICGFGFPERQPQGKNLAGFYSRYV